MDLESKLIRRRRKVQIGNFCLVVMILLMQLALIVGVASMIERKQQPVLPEPVIKDLGALLRKLLEAPPAQAQPVASVTVEEYTPAPIEEEEVIDITLLGPYDADGLPQHMVSYSAPHKSMPTNCPIPEDIWTAINDLNETAEVKAIIAGAGWVESRWNPDCYHYDNDGGHAHGLFCIHGRWRKDDVAWMKSQPGGWRNPENNLKAFLRTIKAHETYYPKSRHSWKYKMSHYNGGKRGNMKYAQKVLTKAKDLERYFEPSRDSA